jgi:ABC-type glycerol-3-phosphate transport system substrate-binding protein
MMLETLEYGPEDSLAVDYESSIADVVNGKAAMTISGTWALGTMRTNNPDIDKDVELIPFPTQLEKPMCRSMLIHRIASQHQQSILMQP